MTHNEQPEYIVRIEGDGAAEASVYDLVAAAMIALRSRREHEDTLPDEQAMQRATDEKRWRFSDRPDAPRDWRHSLR